MSLARYLSKLGALLNSDGKVPSGALASGAARANFGAGAVLQVVSGAMVGSTSQASTSYTDIGGASATITPSSTSSKILVLVDGQYSVYSTGVEGRGNFRVLRDSTTLREALSVGYYFAPDMTSDGNTYGSISYNQLDSPNSTSAITYKVQMACVSGASYVGANLISVTLLEIAG